MRRLAIPAILVLLAGCVSPTGEPSYDARHPTAPVEARPEALAADPAPDVQTAARNFVSVVARMEPVIEDECRARTRNVNCDFRIVVDDKPGQPPNAYQTIDRGGRPVIAFTIPLIAEARNVDELAFIMGHEASHHIRGHLDRQQQSAMAGAILIGGLAAATGGSAEAVRQAQDIGATVGARTYSKDFELEADELGTIIAWDAGYDPERGAAFFTRIPDPGNRFLGSHPPNAQRIEAVRRTLAALRAGMAG